MKDIFIKNKRRENSRHQKNHIKIKLKLMQIKILFGRHCKFVLDWFHYVGRLCIPVMIVSECATFMTV